MEGLWARAVSESRQRRAQRRSSMKVLKGERGNYTTESGWGTSSPLFHILEIASSLLATINRALAGAVHKSVAGDAVGCVFWLHRYFIQRRCEQPSLRDASGASCLFSWQSFLPPFWPSSWPRVSS